MPLETATYIEELVPANPAHADGLNAADAHMRLIKSTLQATFPNFTAAALTSTQAQIDTAVTAMLAAIAANSTVPTGSVMDFAMGTAPDGWLECGVGLTANRVTHADLFAVIGTTWGSGDGSTTFGLPPDRFRRGRNASAAAVGTLQADQNKTHTHTAAGTSAVNGSGHTHTYSGSTGAMSANASHSHNVSNGTVAGTGSFNVAGGATGSITGSGVIVIDAANTDHTHTYSGTTATESATHTHAFTCTTTSGSADGSEVRPLTGVFLTCIKT